MNKTTLASIGDPAGLTVWIAPWPRSGPADFTAMRGIESRVDRIDCTLTLSIATPEAHESPLQCLRRLMSAALPLVRTVSHGTATFPHSGVVLDADHLAEALDGWTDAAIPVHSLVGFDFALAGTPPGTRTIGLRPLVGQEIIAWPPDDALRLVCARMVARLAHDMLMHGPIIAERSYAAPDLPKGQVTLVPRDLPDPVVHIRF